MTTTKATWSIDKKPLFDNNALFTEALNKLLCNPLEIKRKVELKILFSLLDSPYHIKSSSRAFFCLFCFCSSTFVKEKAGHMLNMLVQNCNLVFYCHKLLSTAVQKIDFLSVLSLLNITLTTNVSLRILKYHRNIFRSSQKLFFFRKNCVEVSH